jgi:hypothetical protein
MAGSEATDCPGRPFGLTAPLGRWRSLDRWAAGYATLTLAVLATGVARAVPGCKGHALTSLEALAAILLVAWATRDTRSRLASILRLFLVPILYTSLYRQIAGIWPLFHGSPLDWQLIALEARIFHAQPALAFRAALPWRWLSEVFCFAYLAYYFFTPVIGLTALFSRGYLAAERILTSAAICFFLCYTFFWLAPTVAPHFWFPPHAGPRPYQGYLFNHLLFGFTGRGEVPAGAFPSSHIAVAFLYTLWARRETPRLFPYLAAITALMLPAVVYLGAHYAVDVPAGLLVGLLVYRFTRPAC